MHSAPRGTTHLDLRVVVHRVCVCEQVLLAVGARRYECTAVGGVLALALPGQRVVGFRVDAVHLDDGVKVARLWLGRRGKAG